MESEQLSQQLAWAKNPQKVRLLFNYMKQHGDEHYEEEVTQMEHALQAAYLARSAGKDAELISAALLHDIGHLLADDPAERNHPTEKNDLHEERAAACLQGIFPARVLEPIRLHVIAKRYLCTVEPEYYAALSEASRKSFHLQGGPMSAEEQAAFENNTYFEEAVLLRRWDDEAKLVGKEIPPIEAYAGEVEKVML